MKGGDKGATSNKKEIDEEILRTVRHDIKNQLSNIHMALEQLRYEVTDPSPDCVFYMDSIIMSAEAINKVLIEIE
jgi:hypothetical protein